MFACAANILNALRCTADISVNTKLKRREISVLSPAFCLNQHRISGKDHLKARNVFQYLLFPVFLLTTPLYYYA